MIRQTSGIWGRTSSWADSPQAGGVGGLEDRYPDSSFVVWRSPASAGRGRRRPVVAAVAPSFGQLVASSTGRLSAAAAGRSRPPSLSTTYGPPAPYSAPLGHAWPLHPASTPPLEAGVEKDGGVRGVPAKQDKKSPRPTATGGGSSRGFVVRSYMIRAIRSRSASSTRDSLRKYSRASDSSPCGTSTLRRFMDSKSFSERIS